MPPPDGQSCAHPDCAQPGEFRAPAGPGAATRWRYLCLEHVRAFNQAYDYFRDMTPDELAEAQSPLAGWKSEWTRPETRRFGGGSGMQDSHGLFGEAAGGSGPRRRSEGDRRALAVLGLGEDADEAAVRRRYRELIRRYHPDANDGSRDHEARLQAVIAAYTQLRGRAD